MLLVLLLGAVQNCSLLSKLPCYSTLSIVALETMVIASSSKNKRKGDDSDVSSLSSSFSRSVSVFSPRNPNNASLYSSSASNSSNPSLVACKTRLQSIRQLCQEQPKNGSNNQDITAIMAHIATMRTQTLPQTVTAKLEQADTIQRALRDRIAATQQKLQNESQQAALRRQQYEKLVRHGQFLQTQTAGLEQQCRQLRHEIGKFQENLVSEQEYLELVQQQRQHQVPRLQQQISLYATMTGIKWDFEAQEKEGDDAPVLVGQVVRTVRRTTNLCLNYFVSVHLQMEEHGNRVVMRALLLVWFLTLNVPFVPIFPHTFSLVSFDYPFHHHRHPNTEYSVAKYDSQLPDQSSGTHPIPGRQLSVEHDEGRMRRQRCDVFRVVLTTCCSSPKRFFLCGIIQ